MPHSFRKHRRDFLKVSAAVGGGLALELTVPASVFAQAASKTKGPELTAWIIVNPDNSVLIRVARSEMGQGRAPRPPPPPPPELLGGPTEVRPPVRSPNQHREGRGG